MTQLSLLSEPVSDLNPRYVEYCRAHGATPDEMLARDHERMTGFILWICARWVEWERMTGRKGPHDLAAHVAFDAWLASREASA